MMKDIDLIKENEYTASFIKENDISDEFIEDNFSLFKRVIDSLKLCKDCRGLVHCGQNTRGQRSVLNYLGTAVEEIELCPYAMVDVNKDSIAEKYVYCDVPEALLDITLENINYTEDQKQLYALLLGILHKKKNKGLYIVGDLGVGKTYLCCALANSLVKKNEKVAFVKVSNFFNDMKASLISNSELVDKTMNRLKKVDYLFLDDIGAESVSQFVRDDILFSILDYRLDHKLITIFTSNIDIQALYKHYQYDRNEKSNMMKAQRLLERIDILSDDYVLTGRNMRRLQDA